MKTTTKLYNNTTDRPAGSGELRRLWATRSHALIAALYAAEGFEQAENALYAFDAARASLLEKAAGATPSESAASIADQFAEGEQIDSADFRHRVEDMHHRGQIAELERSVLAGVGRRLFNDRDSIAASAEKAIIGHLQDQLNVLLKRLRAAEVCESDLDPAAAIESGRIDQHKALLQAVAVFADIRVGVSDWHIAHRVGEGVDNYLLAAILRDPLEMAPLAGVVLARLTAFQESTGKKFGPQDLPWPAPDDAPAFLAWLINVDADDIRIPTVRQLKTTLEELRKARSAALAAVANKLRMRHTKGNEFLGQRSHEIEATDNRSRGNLAIIPKHLSTEDGDWRVIQVETMHA